MCFVVDVMFSNSTVSTCAAADKLKSLIPTIGIAGLSQFVDFFKPSIAGRELSAESCTGTSLVKVGEIKLSDGTLSYSENLHFT